MKKLSYLLLMGLLFFACSEDDDPMVSLSDKAELLELNLSVDNVVYTTSINGDAVTLQQPLPFGTEEVEVTTIRVSTGADVDLATGDVITVDNGDVVITVTAEDGMTTQQYYFTPNFGEEMFTVQYFDPVEVSRTNDLPTYAHYMAWFETPEFSEFGNQDFGGWGTHWTMANVDPSTGNVASHYTPLIGAYDNGEDRYLEYVVSCMKLTGLHGVFIDYYSNTDHWDWKMNYDHTVALVPWLEKAGLKYALVYEDNVAKFGEDHGLGNKKDLAVSHFQHMRDFFFQDENYVFHNGKPLTLVFGPQSGMSPEDWDEVVLDEALVLLNGQIPGQSLQDVAAGEYGWSEETVESLEGFYSYCSQYDVCIGSAMPGFEDYAPEGGWSQQEILYIDPQDGQRLRDVLEATSGYDLDYLQVPTWNDWGEGTIVEPSVEFGYQRLEILQEWLGVPYNADDLALAVELYQKRKEYEGNELINLKLDQVFQYLISLQIEEARLLLQEIG